jgi:hypothetical protein
MGGALVATSLYTKINMKLKAAYILLFLSLNLGLATEPLPPPYYEYNITGHLENIKTKSNANYTLQLFGLPQGEYKVDNWVQCKGMNKSYERPIYLTDSTGNFSIRVNNQFLFDSIKVGLINPEKFLFGESVYISERSLVKVEKQYSEPNKNGCTSCSTEPINYITEKYIYTNSSYKIKIGV